MRRAAMLGRRRSSSFQKKSSGQSESSEASTVSRWASGCVACRVSWASYSQRHSACRPPWETRSRKEASWGRECRTTARSARPSCTSRSAPTPSISRRRISPAMGCSSIKRAAASARYAEWGRTTQKRNASLPVRPKASMRSNCSSTLLA
ncbi:hypothetical protein SDC9_207526 [bioreactor metagenome]|uniref:Uncharacterized protein n=1 Tax=bioreactor metagenome TaxID=1076179 RepID=A0A645JHI1_9ZZZZ